MCIKELLSLQGDRGPKGLTGLKGAAGFKVRVPACSCSNVPLTVGYFYDFVAHSED